MLQKAYQTGRAASNYGSVSAGRSETTVFDLSALVGPGAGGRAAELEEQRVLSKSYQKKLVKIYKYRGSAGGGA